MGQRIKQIKSTILMRAHDKKRMQEEREKELQRDYDKRHENMFDGRVRSMIRDDE